MQERVERVQTNLQQKHGNAKRIVKGTERNWLFPFVFEFVYCRFSYLFFHYYY